MTIDPETFDKLRMELRRGAIVLAVLGKLRHEHYGYSLRQALDENGVHIDEGTLYPLVRRLEKQGLLESEWREEGKRKKRFYHLSEGGREVFDRLLAEWRNLDDGLRTALEEEDEQ